MLEYDQLSEYDQSNRPVPSPDAVREEQDRLETIRYIVDDVARRIQGGLLTQAEARELAARVRFQMTRLIPDQMDTYDLIYASRFERLINQFIPRASPADH